MPLPRYRGNATPQAKPRATNGTSDKQFARAQKLTERMRFERSGLLPTSTQDFAKLQEWYNKFRNEEKENKLRQNDIDVSMAREQNRELARVIGGKIIGNGNVGVLGLPTIWARNWKPTDLHPEAPWPSPREFREEGDERHTSNYGRFLPIPRVPGNKTVVYKQKSWCPVEDLDKVMPVPKLYGMVNINLFGFYDIHVDVNGVPYDDEALPGKECFVKKSVVDKSGEKNKSQDATCSMQDADKVIDKEIDAAAIYNLTPARSGFLLHPGAAPFVPRNIPALNSGSINDATFSPGTANSNNSDAIVNFLGHLIESTSITSSKEADTKPEFVGFADPFETRDGGRGNLRIDTSVNGIRGDASLCMLPKDSSYLFDIPILGLNMKKMSPRAAFQYLNAGGIQKLGGGRDRSNSDESFNAVFSPEQEDLRTGLTSPLELFTPTGFSSTRPGAHKPKELNLKSISNTK